MTAQWFMYIGTRTVNDTSQTIINFTQDNPTKILEARQLADPDFKYRLFTALPVDDIAKLRRFVSTTFATRRAKRDCYNIDIETAMSILTHHLYGVGTSSAVKTHLLASSRYFGQSMWILFWKLLFFTIAVTITLTYSILLGIFIGIVLLFIFKKDD